MAPRKRSAEVGEAKEEAAATATMRVTRSASRPAARVKSVQAEPPVQKAEASKRRKTKEEDMKKADIEEEPKEEEVRENKEEAEKEDKEEGSDGGSESKTRTVVIEHCKQCSSFKTRANLVKDGLEKAVPHVAVVVNPEKPRRGCFEIREGGETFISLLDMKRPFKPMKELDMDQVVSDIIKKLN